MTFCPKMVTPARAFTNFLSSDRNLLGALLALLGGLLDPREEEVAENSPPTSAYHFKLWRAFAMPGISSLDLSSVCFRFALTSRFVSERKSLLRSRKGAQSGIPSFPFLCSLPPVSVS